MRAFHTRVCLSHEQVNICYGYYNQNACIHLKSELICFNDIRTVELVMADLKPKPG